MYWWAALHLQLFVVLRSELKSIFLSCLCLHSTSGQRPHSAHVVFFMLLEPSWVYVRGRKVLVFCVGRRAALIPGSAPSLERGSWPLVPEVAAGGQSSSQMDCLCCVSHMNTWNTYCLVHTFAKPSVCIRLKSWFKCVRLHTCMPVHVFPDLCACQRVQLAAQCVYIFLLTVCARHRGTVPSFTWGQGMSSLPPPPLNVPHTPHPRAPAGQQAPPGSPGQADLPGIWLKWTRLRSPGPAQGQEVKTEHITAPLSGPGQGGAEAAWTQQTFCSFSQWTKKEFHCTVGAGWEKSTQFPISQ